MDEIQKLGMDASDYIEAIDLIVGANGRLLNSNVAVLKSFSATYNDIGDRVGTALKLVVDNNKLLSASFKEEEGELKSFQATVSNLPGKLQTASQAIREHARSYEALKSIQADVADQKVFQKTKILSPIAFASIKDELTKAFGSIPTDAPIAAVQRIGTAIGKLSTQVANGNVSFQELKTVINSVKNNEILPPNLSANKEVQSLTTNIASLGQQLVSVNNKSKAAFNSIANGADRASVKAAKLQAQNLVKGNAALQGLTLPGTFENVKADITKSLGSISVSANASDIQKINVAYGQLAQSINSGKITYQQFLTQLDAVKNKKFLPPDINEEVNKARTSLATLASSIEGVEGRSGRLIITLQGALRLFAVQTAHAFLARIINLLEEATKAASEFGTKIALIQTISQDQAATVNEWSTSLRKLSDELGKPVVELASAGYQALSNQVTKGREDTEAFLRTAANFSRTVGATTTEGVDLLSTAIKGLGLDLGQSEHIAATFFNAIDYGRLTAAGFNQTLGRAVPLAKDLKISLEELTAAEAALTLQGFNAEEAGTRLTNLLLGLEKPSEKLKVFFGSFGARTGREFVTAVGGFENVIKELSDGTKSGVVNLEELFPELRKLQAAFGLVNDGGKTFSQTLTDITNGTERYKKAQQITQEPFSKKFNDELNKLINVFTVDFATKFQKVFVNLSDALGGFSNKLIGIGGIIKDLTLITAYYFVGSAAIAGVIAGWSKLVFVLGELKAAYQLGSIAALLFNNSIALSASTLGGVFLGAFAATYIALNKLRESYQAFLNETSQKNKIDFDINVGKFKANLSIVTEGVINHTAQWIQIYQKVASRLTIILTTELETQKLALKDVGKAAENSFKGVTEILLQGVRNLETAAKKASDIANETAKNIENIQKDQAAREFDTARELIKAQHQAAGGSGTSRPEEALILNQIALLKEKAKAALEEEKTDPNKAGLFVKYLEQAQQLNDSLKSGYIEQQTKLSLSINTLDAINETTGQLVVKTNGLGGAYGNVNTYLNISKDLTQQLIDLTNQQHEAQLKNSITLEKIARQQKVAVDDAIDAYKKFTEFSLLDKEGKIRTPPNIEGQPSVKEQNDFIKGELEKAQKLQQDAENKLKNVYNEVLKNPLAGLRSRLDLQNIAKQQLEEFHKKSLDQGEAQLTVGKTAEKIRSNEIVAKKFADEGERSQKAFKDIEESLNNTKKTIEGNTKLAKDLATAISGSGKLDAQSKGLPELTRDLHKGPEAVPNLLQIIKDLSIKAGPIKVPETEGSPPNIYPGVGKEQIDLPGGKSAQLNTSLEALKNSIIGLPGLFEKLKGQEAELENAKRHIELFDHSLDSLPIGILGASDGFRIFAITIKSNTLAIDGVLKELTNAFQQGTFRLQAVRSPDQPVQQQSEGGLIKYYANGGVFKPKGTDTIPAMLSPNEFVVSQKGTSLFLNELKLMNKGINPYSIRTPYFADGGMLYRSEGNIVKPLINNTSSPLITQKGINKFVNKILSVNQDKKPVDFEKNLLKSLNPIIQQTTSSPKDIKSLIKKFIPIVENSNSVSVNTSYHSSGGIVKTFSPQTPSMNKITLPRYLNEGGKTGDTNFGNINVHITDSSKNPNLGANVAQQIRRELRRGTLKF